MISCTSNNWLMAALYLFLENLSLFLCQGLNYKEIQWTPFSMFHLSSQSSHQPLSVESKKIVCNLQSQVMILQGGLSGSVKIQSGTKTTITLHLCKVCIYLKNSLLALKEFSGYLVDMSDWWILGPQHRKYFCLYF